MNRTNVYETIGALLGACYQRITNWKHCLVMPLVLVLSSSTWAQTPIQKVLVGGIQFDSTDPYISAYKVEAALAIALEASGRYALIPNVTRDSLVRTARNDSMSVQVAADRLGAELIAFCSIGRIANLVRMEVVIVGGDGWVVTTSGVGYGTSFLQSDSSKKRIIDPAILSATQRALCVAVLDSALYAQADSGFIVRPTQLAAVGGIEFVVSNPDLAPWSIMREKIAASYDAVSTIVAAMRQSAEISVVDIESRDSIYALAGLYMVENYNPLSRSELTILKGFEVTHVITGRFERKKGGAELTLIYNEIKPDASYTPIKKAQFMVAVDSKLAFQDGVRACLRKLFGSITEPAVQK
ncbi:MAG TPA: hypothetical protein VK147_08890 [Candidatus Didemnitutus sp.]|nr:hypothetical protein [Candidatus Didemnitutus sp.]